MNVINVENKNILKKTIKLLNPYKKYIVYIILCMIGSCLISMILPLVNKELMDNGLIEKNIKVIINLCIVNFVLLLVEQIIIIFETKFESYVSVMMPYNLNKKAFKHLLKLKIEYFNEKNFAEIMNNINIDISNVCKISDRTSFFLMIEIFRMIGGLIGLIIIDYKLTALILLIIPIRYTIVNYFAKKRKELFQKYMEYNRDYSAWYGDTISGIKEIKLWGLETIKTGQFIKKQRNIVKINIRMFFLDKINEILETLIFQIIVNSLYIIGGYMLMKSNITVGSLLAFITYSTYVTSPISSILNIKYNFSNVIPSAKRLFQFLDTDCETFKGLHINDINKNHLNIQFENVSFYYNKDKIILNNINIKIDKCEKIAIIGENGSGKSTLINLFLRLYKPCKGKILINGTNINDFNLKEYRKLISVVNQEIYLFNQTIKENIILNSRIREKQLNKIYKNAKLNEFINKLPNKSETNVGRNGSNLSGGEKQKIAMARALARGSEILILDEATANLDIQSESYINQLINKEFREKTVIVISHRTDILKYMDKVFELKNGQVNQIELYDILKKLS
ncbi:ABC transporter ATP-binding protein [Clostridium botulinum]|uniref:ABC transporter ATP-binding protein n=1 Tax=Clostridium botulinum TaxID=1491 RepID=UPI003BEED45D